MRPYLAILKDSFREALASRVLWILLLITAVVLAGLAGFGLEERAGAYFAPSDLYDPLGLAKSWQTAGKRGENTPAGVIWRALDEDARARLADLLATNAPAERFVDPVQGILNRLLQARQLDQQRAWPQERLDAEAMDLLREGAEHLNAVELARLNRLLLEAAFPRELAPSRERELFINYYGLEIPTGGLPLLRRDYLIKTAAGIISSFFLGFLGLFAGLIVTSALIPQTFEPGAVDLLLSKPIVRVGLYLTKFVGGCMFVLLNTLFLLGGLFVLVGLRHGVWMWTLPLCVPVFLFWFMVFYSVSALIGLWSRNAIVAVTITICLWGVCALLAFVKKSVIEGALLDPTRLVQVTAVWGESSASEPGELFSLAESGQVFRWNVENRHWDEILLPDNPRRLRAGGGSAVEAGPLYHTATQRLILAQRTARRWNSWVGGGTPLIYGGPEDQFRRHEGPPAPAGACHLGQDAEGNLLVVGMNGLWRHPGNFATVATPEKRGAKILGVEITLPNFAQGTPAAEFTLLTPTQTWVAPISAASNPTGTIWAVFQRGRLQVFELATSGLNEGRYVETRQQAFSGHEQGLVALADKTVLIALDDGQVVRCDLPTLQRVSTQTPVAGVPVRFLEAAPDGQRVTAVLHDRSLWIYEVAADRWTRAPVSGQGDISAASWDAAGQLWVVDAWHRATRYQVPKWTSSTVVQNDAHWLELLDLYLLRPLYAFLPKPGSADALVNYLLTDQQTSLRGQLTGGLRATRELTQIWEPLISHAVFLACMLGLGCWFIHVRDF
ncbi:MAG: LpqB family beta-propeller domain-containing protein [Pirellulales bacterium]|nr:LpqB family beta-propeller domain-containing protein [Pirellulales bacterium]